MRSACRRNARSTKKTLRELLEPLVAFVPGPVANSRDMRMETRLSPSVAGGLFSIPGCAFACALEQSGSGRFVEVGRISRRQRKATNGAAAGVFVDESAGQFGFSVLSGRGSVSEVRCQGFRGANGCHDLKSEI